MSFLTTSLDVRDTNCVVSLFFSCNDNIYQLSVLIIPKSIHFQEKKETKNYVNINIKYFNKFVLGYNIILIM